MLTSWAAVYAAWVQTWRWASIRSKVKPGSVGPPGGRAAQGRSRRAGGQGVEPSAVKVRPPVCQLLQVLEVRLARDRGVGATLEGVEPEGVCREQVDEGPPDAPLSDLERGMQLLRGKRTAGVEELAVAPGAVLVKPVENLDSFHTVPREPCREGRRNSSCVCLLQQ